MTAPPTPDPSISGSSVAPSPRPTAERHLPHGGAGSGQSDVPAQRYRGPSSSQESGGGVRQATAHPQVYIELCRVADLALAIPILLGAFLASNIHRMPNGFEDFLAIRLTVKNALLLGLFAACWRVICIGAGLYSWRWIRRPKDEASRVLLATSAASLIALVFPLISVTGAFSLVTPLYFWCAASAVMISVRGVLRRMTASDRPARKTVLIVGSGPRALKLHDDLVREDTGASAIQGFVDTADFDHCLLSRCQRLGSLDDLEHLLINTAIDEVLIALPIKSRYAEIQTALEICARIGVPAKYPADAFTAGRAQARYDASEARPVVSVPAGPDDARLLIKRALDLLGAVIALVLLAPLMLAAAAAVKLTSAGPVLFAQERYGRNRRRFQMYKFRTMIAQAEELQASLEQRNEVEGPVFKIAKDPRITKVGGFLRRTSIDELPQLWNVLRGEMSLVGPRPLPVRDVHRFTEGALMRRFSVTPGLTCLWQISGRSKLCFDDWIRLDLQYIDEWSLTLDLEILAKTVPVVVRGTGAS